FCFSSRGRHTRFSRDWSSDVCSSDLVEVGQIPAATVESGGVADLAGLLDHVVEVVAHAAEAGEVGLHLLAGLVGGDLQLLGEPVGAQSVGEAVGHRLDAATQLRGDRKSTRLNSSHVKISYAVFCLKTKTKTA